MKTRISIALALLFSANAMTVYGLIYCAPTSEVTSMPADFYPHINIELTTYDANDKSEYKCFIRFERQILRCPADLKAEPTMPCFGTQAQWHQFPKNSITTLSNHYILGVSQADLLNHSKAHSYQDILKSFNLQENGSNVLRGKGSAQTIYERFKALGQALEM